MAFRILIIEDEQSLLETLKLNLDLEGYDVFTCNNGLQGVSSTTIHQPDLILLDIMLPEISGIDIYKQLKKMHINIPVIFLTAKNTVQDKIEGLKLGADDYITKPFELEELLLRIQNVLKRNQTKKESSTIFEFNDCAINFSTFQVVSIEGKKEDLSKREIALLKMLVDNLNKVVSRDDILEKLWTKEETSSSRTIDNYILNFRKLFEPNPKEPIHFLSIRGVGYKFCV